jgi:hypothetical protein
VAQPNPALGIPAGFDEQAFRNAMAFSMQMGKPNDLDRKPVFLKKSTGRTYSRGGEVLWSGSGQPPPAVVRTGRKGEPLDPTIKVVPNDDVEVEVDCAIEVEDVKQEDLPVGNFKPVKLTVTVLDTEYAKLAGVKELKYNGDHYMKSNEPEIDGLFGVDVHQLVFFAVDES